MTAPRPGHRVRWTAFTQLDACLRFAEGVLVRLHTPRVDPCVDVLVERSNFLEVGTTQTLGLTACTHLVEIARPDGFLQSAVDAALAAILAPAPPRYPRRRT